MPINASSLLGAAGDLLGGYLGFRNQTSANRLSKQQFSRSQRLNAQSLQDARSDTNFWNQWNYKLASRQLAESKLQHRQALKENKRQFELGRQRSIRDKVRDAKASGLHPLFALGASGTSPAPISAGGVAGGFIPGQSPVGSFAESGQSYASNALGAGVSSAASRLMPNPPLSESERLSNQLRREEIKESRTRQANNLAVAAKHASETKTGAQAYNYKRAAGDGVNINARPDQPTRTSLIGKLPTKNPHGNYKKMEDEFPGMVEILSIMDFLETSTKMRAKESFNTVAKPFLKIGGAIGRHFKKSKNRKKRTFQSGRYK